MSVNKINVSPLMEMVRDKKDLPYLIPGIIDITRDNIYYTGRNIKISTNESVQETKLDFCLIKSW